MITVRFFAAFALFVFMFCATVLSAYHYLVNKDFCICIVPYLLWFGLSDCLFVCLSCADIVCQRPNRSSWFFWLRDDRYIPSANLILYYKAIQVSPKYDYFNLEIYFKLWTLPFFWLFRHTTYSVIYLVRPPAFVYNTSTAELWSIWNTSN